MRAELLERLRAVTPEEQTLLEGHDVQKELYTSRREFVVDSRKLLEKGQLIEIRPHTRFCHFPNHRHNYVEMVYMAAGTTTHVLNGSTEIRLKAGDLLFLSQNTWHEILPASEGDLAVNFIILPEFFHRPISMIEQENVLRDFLISTLSGETGNSTYFYIQTGGVVPVENLVENMIWTLLMDPSGTSTIIQTSMGLLLMNLSRFADSLQGGAADSAEQKQVLAVLQYIDTNYRSGTLEEISSSLRIPASTVSRMLKRQTGGSFKALLQSRKLQQAAFLLRNTPLSADAVIEQVGYENRSYFYRIFRERYGCTPREYRDQGWQLAP